MTEWITPQQQFALGWDIFPLLPRLKTEYASLIPEGAAAHDGDYRHPKLGTLVRPTRWVNGWERLTAEQVDELWPPSGGGHNVGVATGRRSGVWVLDVDRTLEDEDDAREYVSEITGIEIPRTLSVKTASGKWHFYFKMPESQDVYIKSSVAKLGPNIDVRGDGGMAMGICSSVVDDQGEVSHYCVNTMMSPAYAPIELIDRIKRQAAEITPMAPASVEKDVDPAADAVAQEWIDEELGRLRNLHRPWVVGSNWHNTCFEVACQISEFANSPWCSLTPDEAMRRYLEAAPPAERDWNPLTEWREGVTKTEGQGRLKPLTASDQSWFHDIGVRRNPTEPRPDGEPVEEIVFTSPRHWEGQIAQAQKSIGSYDLASQIRNIVPVHDEAPILCCHLEVWYYWNGAYWAEADVLEVQDWVARQLALVEIVSKGEGDKVEKKRLAPGMAKVRDVCDWLASLLRVPDQVLEKSATVHVTNGAVTVEGRLHREASPLIFNLSALPFAYDDSATCPQWESFLMDIFEHDPAAAMALQEWFGYFLVGDPAWLQKMFWLIGPKRSGKGTILNIARALMGQSATATSLTILSKDFGRENLIGKNLVIIDDARDPDPRVAHSVVEFLLTLSAGGFTSVQRKNRRSWDGVLTSSLFAASNTVPRLPDDGGAISSRLEIIKTRKSFIGHEDTHLADRLMTELPGILNWSLDGLDRLRSHDRFTQAAMATGVRADVDRGATGATPFVQALFAEHETLGVSRRMIRDAMEWWSQQQEDSYKASAPSMKAAIRAEFPDAKEDVRNLLADGSVDKHAWRGIVIQCQHDDCQSPATRVSIQAGPECPMHLSSILPSLVS